MNQFEERLLWELHKSPRSQIDHLLGSPRDYSLFERMVEEGSLVQSFRFRGFPNQAMEKPTLPVTLPVDRHLNGDELSSPLWLRRYGQPSDGEGGGGRREEFVHGEHPMDNAPRRRGLRSPPYHPPSLVDTGRSYPGRGEREGQDSPRYQAEVRQDLWRERDSPRYQSDRRQDLWRERDRSQFRSPERDSRQGPRGRYQASYQPDNSLYHPSFGQPGSPGPSGQGVYSSQGAAGSPPRDTWGIPVTDFIKRQELEVEASPRQSGLDLLSSRDEVGSPRREGWGRPGAGVPKHHQGESSQGPSGLDLQRTGGGGSSPVRDVRGIPVIDFLPRDPLAGQVNPGQSGLDLVSNRGGASSPRRGIPVTDFIRQDELEGQVNPGQSGLDLASNRGGASSPRRGIPVTDFIRQDELEVGGRAGKSSNRTSWLPDDPLYDPFGRAGGGAPVWDSEGRKRTNVFGNFEKKNDPREVEQDLIAKNRMRQDLFRGIEEQRLKRDQDLEYQRRPDTDLADLMQRKEVGRPRVDPQTGTLTGQHLPTSDVTRQKMNYQPLDGREVEEYRQFLQQQMADRERDRQQDRLRQRHEADQHFATFDSQWGQWGGRAPKDHRERRKLKLDDSLQRYSDSQLVSPSYEKIYEENDLYGVAPGASPRYVRNTVNSTSVNFYQNPRSSYRTNAPYATGYTYGI